ncbi:MAG TPA: carboxypeptidase-like regulatory domain-containing protein, partial [Thermoanaerobaculia bacterium]|nr:carboxypeptidase-like regulatory domain-containing protein [Thermoanaerobaculia bacterium]
GEVSFGSTEPGVNSYGSAPTDENGAYEITGLTPGKFRVTVMDTTRYSSMYSGSHEVTGSETFDIEVRSAAVRGRVVDLDSGKGIDGALVTLDSLDSLDVPTRSRISVATSPNGEFVLSGVPEGGYKAIAQKEHYAEGISEVTVDAGGSQPIELKMQLAEGLLVRVVDRRDSRPLDARFFVNDSLGSLVFDRGRDSPASDTARISLPEGRYSLSVSVYGFATRTVDLQIPSPDVLIALSPGGSLVITSSATEGRVGQLVNASGKPYQRSLYRPDGKFEIKSGTTTIESIESGAYVLRVYDNKGKVENTRPVVIKEGETTAAGL